MRRLSVLTAILAVAVAGCGGDDNHSSGSSGGGSQPIVVSAAASLQNAFTTYGKSFGGPPRFSFAGSDELAAQIRQGVKPDVFAAANTKLPEALNAAGLAGKPTVFAGNRLVLAVPATGPDITTLAGVEKPGVKLAIGSATVPVGTYTRKVLGGLPSAKRRQVLANVRSQEPDVKGVVGKLTQGAVDAGFVYITDVKATKGALKAIELPKALKPSAAYGAVVVKGAKHPAEARKFIDGLVDGKGQSALRAAGFEPRPR